ncbi:MAG TPA: CocE/NonD family hydrolase [Thermoleophilaceae bacterium]|nr:CocE/NonD family hydrolase [Thermoleophilaceae bacterium]
MRRLLIAACALAALTAAPAQAAPTHYVTTPDGASIAINVKVPDHCTAETPCPTFFEMSGYESGSDEGQTPLGHLADDTGIPFPLQTGTRAAHAAHVDDRYVTVLASVRGTGCSSGEFDLFSWQSALDGRHIIDEWIPEQPWSDGDVVIFGHSYSGLTGMFVASTRPEHLRAVSASGLIGDLYRDITYIGGVTNYGFPLLWTGGVRPLYDVGGGTVGGVYPVEDTSEQCAANQAGRSRTVLDEPLVQGTDDTDTEWMRARSLVNFVDRIEVPVHITAAYQDEQTGPRGPTYVFDKLSDSISKRLVLVNGAHGTQTSAHIREDRFAWMDYWMLGKESADLGIKSGSVTLSSVFGPRETATETSRVILGYQGNGNAVGEIASDGFPLGETQFTDLYATGSGLTFDQSAVQPGKLSWVNGSRRQSYSYQAGVNQGGRLSSPTGPDEVELAYEFTQATAIAGPITANLFVSSSAPDTELFVQLIDRAPDGTLLYLNRGLLRGSHRQVDGALSQRAAGGRIYRPFRPHAGRSLVMPGAVTDYLIDIFPVGHVFLPGHELVVKVHAPPLDDNDYAYVQKTLPGENTLHFGPQTPTRLMLPIVPMSEVDGFTTPTGKCPYASMRCLSGQG